MKTMATTGGRASEHAPKIATSSFVYELPSELIAKEAVEPRDAARLLVNVPSADAAPAELHDATFADLSALLPPHTHLVMNHSAVFSARLHAYPQQPAAGVPLDAGANRAVEVMILGPEPPERDPSRALLEPADGQLWRAMVRMRLEEPGLALLTQPTPVAAASGPAPAAAGVSLHVERLLGEWVEEGEEDGVEAVVRFDISGVAAGGTSGSGGGGGGGSSSVNGPAVPLLNELFDALGETPLPPYMERDARPDDRDRYQTVYAAHERRGSVAAPTAGLHFTPALLDRLEAGGVRTSRVALHVGAGTFKPVTAPSVDQHEMHAERFSVSNEELEALARSAKAGYPIVPVGTTSARVLESIYWMGLGRLHAASAGSSSAGSSSADSSASSASSASAAASAASAASAADSAADSAATSRGWASELDLGHLGQWPGYAEGDWAAADAVGLPDILTGLVRESRQGGHAALCGSTSLCIAPGYAFRVCDALITNFHAPDSTLMMLVSAMVGSSEQLTGTVYRHALAQRYRFLSYGDACLLFSATRRNAAALATSVRANLAMLSALRDADSALAEATAGGDAAAANAGGDAGAVQAASQWSGPRLPQSLQKSGRKVLLHSCCAPCSGAMVESMVHSGHDVTVFFYNPNIHPRKEYEIRKQENKRYAEQLGIDFVDLDGDVVGGIDVDEWYKRAKGMEFCPERGARCSMCFDMRLERTALYAFEHGFDSFTTTNATSRWKDEAQVNASGMKAASKYAGVEYWLSDWQGEEMTARKYRINAEQKFYKQEYCGCSYSLRDSNHWRGKQGLPPVEIGGDSYYSDPVVDEQEEAVEVVESFFSDSTGFEEELKKTYAARRKDVRKGDERANNW